MGKFEKGHTKKGGRDKGTGNKDLEPIRTAFKAFVENNLNKVQDNFDTLSDKDKLFFILNFAEYCIPKLQRTELGGIDGQSIPINISKTYEKPGNEKIFTEE